MKNVFVPEPENSPIEDLLVTKLDDTYTEAVRELAQAQQQHVIVYGKPKCPRCEFVKKWLREHHIDFKYVNVAKNPVASTFLQKLNFASLPVTSNAGKFVVGANLKQLALITK